MTSLKMVFYLACLVFMGTAQSTDLTASSQWHEDRSLISADVGDDITLRCDLKEKASRYHWYKQSHRQKPKLVSSFYKFEETGQLHGEFQRERRFSLETLNQKNDLKISNVQRHDSAIYYCVSNFANVFEFEESTTVVVKGSGWNVQARVYQSESVAIQPQGSVTLNCTVHGASCDGEHRVYWFKNSRASQPALLYTHRDKTRRCERTAATRAHACVYELPMDDLNQSHAGSYYCAVVSCGRIVFGNGTRLEIEETTRCPVLVGALTLTSVFSILSTFLLYRMNKKIKNQTEDSQTTFPASSKSSRDEENLHYAAVRINKTNRSRRHMDETRQECVYSTVKQ